MSEAQADNGVRALALKREALLENGHFLLSSGLHSDKYFQCAKILQWPDDAAFCAKALAKQFLKAGIAADLVLAPAMGGLFIGYETARALGVRSIFLERVDKVFALKRGFEIKSNECIIIIEDVITTGKSTLEVVEYVKNQSLGIVVGVGSIANRIEEHRRDTFFQALGVPYMSLIEVNAKAIDPAACPACKKGLPAIKPGSRS